MQALEPQLPLGAPVALALQPAEPVAEPPAGPAVAPAQPLAELVPIDVPFDEHDILNDEEGFLDALLPAE